MGTKRKTNVSKDSFGDLLIEGLKMAKDHAEEKVSLNSETLIRPSEPPKYTKTRIKKLRKTLNLSQPVFAIWLNVTPSTVKAWEQGENSPGKGICRLLQILEFNPEIFKETILKSA